MDDGESNYGKSSSRFNKPLASVFILLFLFVALTDVLPSSRLAETINPIVDPVRTATGFQQGWALFSPNPLSVEVEAYAVAYTADGGSQQWWPTDDMNRINSSRHERWRKWESRIRLDDNETYWEATTRYVAAQTNSGSNPVVRVRLIRTWSEVPPATESNDNRAYEIYHFYEWDAATQTGRVLAANDQP